MDLGLFSCVVMIIIGDIVIVIILL